MAAPHTADGSSAPGCWQVFSFWAVAMRQCLPKPPVSRGRTSASATTGTTRRPGPREECQSPSLTTAAETRQGGELLRSTPQRRGRLSACPAVVPQPCAAFNPTTPTRRTRGRTARRPPQGSPLRRMRPHRRVLREGAPGRGRARCRVWVGFLVPAGYPDGRHRRHPVALGRLRRPEGVGLPRAGQRVFPLVMVVRPLQDSNLRTRLRRPALIKRSTRKDGRLPSHCGRKWNMQRR